MNKPALRSIAAVLAGLFFIIIVTTLVDVALHAVHAYPPPGEPMTHGHAVLASSYRLVISIAGAYLTARLSPGRGLRDALVLGCVGALLGTVGAAVTWNLGLGPRWYAVSLAVLAVPQCWFGGWLFERRQPAVSPATAATR